MNRVLWSWTTSTTPGRPKMRLFSVVGERWYSYSRRSITGGKGVVVGEEGGLKKNICSEVEDVPQSHIHQGDSSRMFPVIKSIACKQWRSAGVCVRARGFCCIINIQHQWDMQYTDQIHLTSKVLHYRPPTRSARTAASRRHSYRVSIFYTRCLPSGRRPRLRLTSLSSKWKNYLLRFFFKNS